MSEADTWKPSSTGLRRSWRATRHPYARGRLLLGRLSRRGARVPARTPSAAGSRTHGPPTLPGRHDRVRRGHGRSVSGVTCSFARRRTWADGRERGQLQPELQPPETMAQASPTAPGSRPPSPCARCLARYQRRPSRRRRPPPAARMKALDRPHELGGYPGIRSNRKRSGALSVLFSTLR